LNVATPYKDRLLDTEPPLNPGDEPYFEAAASGRLFLKICGDCGKHHHYPRGFCPHCGSQNVSWVEASGLGTIYSVSLSRRVGPTPFAIAFVTLDEGPSMMTNIVDCGDLEQVQIGQRVAVTFKTTVVGVSIPMFKPHRERS
jgi:uncharacterized OB-fold protein